MKNVYMVFYWNKLEKGKLKDTTTFVVFDSLKAAKKCAKGLKRTNKYTWVNTDAKISIYKCGVLTK